MQKNDVLGEIFAFAESLERQEIELTSVQQR